MKFAFFNRTAFWILAAWLGFFCLPVKALHYGLFGSTSAERYHAMGWANINISWLWFAPLALWLIPFKVRDVQRQSMWNIGGASALALFVLISAKLTNTPLGYAVFPLFIALLAITTNAFARLNYLQGDRFLIASFLITSLTVLCFIAYPIIAIFSAMFAEGYDQVLALLQRSYLLTLIGNSLSVALTVGFLATFFGLLLALYTTRIANKTRFISKFFSLLPIVTPPFVVGLGVTLMLGRSGYITPFLMEYFGFKQNWLYGFNGIVLAHTLALTPIAFMILEGAIKSLNMPLEEASYTLRANGYQMIFSVLLPLLKPALANVFLIVVIQSLADFSTPFVLGGSFDVIATQIYFAIVGSQLDYVGASTLGTLLLGFSLLVFALQYLWIGKKSYTTVAGRHYRGQLQPLPKMLRAIITAFLIGWILFNLTLYGSIFIGSFTRNWGVDNSFTLANYVRLFGQGFDMGAFPSLIQTLLFSLIAAPITAILGLLLAYLSVRKHFKGKQTLEFVTLLCFAVPGTVAGLSYVIAFNHAPLYLTGTGLIIILSMVTRNLPIGMRASVASLKQIDHALDEASLSLKANAFKTLWFVIFPLIKPAFISALVTSFVRAMTTVSAIIFLVTADTRVATSYILNRVENGEYGLAVAYGSALIMLMMAIILLFEWMVGRTSVKSR